jgi:hypothetical protein
MRATIDCRVPGAAGRPLAPPMSPTPGSVSTGGGDSGCLGSRDAAAATAAAAAPGPAA